MGKSANHIRAALLGASALALAIAAPAAAQERSYHLDLPAQPLAASLMAFGSTTDQQIVFTDALVSGRTAPAVRGDYTPEQALASLLAGTGLIARRNADGVLMVQPEGGSGPQSASAGGDVDALIVTAQKREENIQDVPIAISAFSQKALNEQKIEGGFDLLKAIPNVTFSKNNFTSYNFSIRGIGTKAISATTDPGVAVAFNYSGLIQNRLFEQEYFDVERVEVLRGPQGTLYGRNATGGVINVISRKADLDSFDGELKAEVGNYNSRRVNGFLNVPLIEDRLALRLAGSATQRDGYGWNEQLNTPVDGRDLWSSRLSIGFRPTERLHAEFIWERFEENDDRARTSKQLCHRDPGPEGPLIVSDLQRALFSTGCKAGSLYDEGAFGTPNGLALPYVFAVPQVAITWYPLGADRPYILQDGMGSVDPDAITLGAMPVADPYGGMAQSRDLRTISSIRNPQYRAKADVLQLNVDWDISDSLTLVSQTLYNEDSVYSVQDYNRFNTVPIFTNTSLLYSTSQQDYGLWDWDDTGSFLITNPAPPSPYAGLMPGGVFCDPQLGCSNRLAVMDISSAEGSQFSQELRLQSNFSGNFDFSVGANYTKFDVVADYYVMSNMLTLLAMMMPFNNTTDFNRCGDMLTGGTVPMEDGESIIALFRCVYIDPNPIESINGEGHNYFRSKNPYKLRSSAVFGEAYWQFTDALKLTAGLRYTNDRKVFTPVPSQLLLGTNIFSSGTTFRGYPAKPDIDQRWREFTGRVGVDWQPDWSLTDQTLLYAFYSRGYKGGGANPPGIGVLSTKEEFFALFDDEVLAQEMYDGFWENTYPLVRLTAQNYPATFRPEFVNSFEVGAKNTLLEGAMILNATAFLYDYKDYQVSKIVDRTAVNENFDAKVWGLELETVFQPTRNLRINANLGYLDTEIADGARSIDIMNRTQGRPGWVTMKPWIQLPSNCIIPQGVADNYLAERPSGHTGRYNLLCGGYYGYGAQDVIDPNTNAPYDPSVYPEINGGAGFHADLGGNELPNSPHWTFNIGAQYSWDVLDGWEATVRGDFYRQSQSFARVYNTQYDKLRGWHNANLRLTLQRPDDDLTIEAYVKNVFDDDPITDAFTNSDDTGLTTNVFVLDPRLIGFSITKGF